MTYTFTKGNISFVIRLPYHKNKNVRTGSGGILMFWGTAYSVSDLILDYICDIIYNFYLFKTEQL